MYTMGKPESTTYIPKPNDIVEFELPLEGDPGENINLSVLAGTNSARSSYSQQPSETHEQRCAVRALCRDEYKRKLRPKAPEKAHAPSLRYSSGSITLMSFCNVPSLCFMPLWSREKFSSCKSRQHQRSFS
jgi:hypothetical protein